MIEVSNITKSFGALRALDGVSFRAEPGQILGFLGPNGAGKTTTMRILTGFLPPDSGTAKVAGFDVRERSLDVRRTMGYLPEAVPLYPEMRIGEYLRFRSRLKDIPMPRRRSAIDLALQQAGVADVRRRVIGTLSRGYRQRVGLADALLGEPRVLILDEPTVGLDPEQVRGFRSLLAEVGRDRTVILSTHILSEVELVCSAVVIIHRGRIVAQDTPENLRKRLGSTERTLAEIAASPVEVREVLEKDPRVLRVTVVKGDPYHRVSVESRAGEDLREAVFAAARDRGWFLRELRRETLTLEEIFVEAVGR